MSSFIKNWRCIESGFEDGPINMAMDEMLLNMSIRNDVMYPILRFFGFRPRCVTFGISQSYEDSHTLKRLKGEGYQLTRRPTGGGAVIHEFDICYALSVRAETHSSFQNVAESYEAVHQAIYAGFRHEGIELEFSDEGAVENVAESVCTDDIVRGDLLYRGRKIAGAAERRRSGYLLHQGFVSLKPFVNTRTEFFAFYEKMRHSIKEGFRDRFGVELTTGGVFLDEAEEAVALKNEKYSTDRWNFEGEGKTVHS